MKTGKKILKIQQVLENALSFFNKNFFILFFASFIVYIIFSLIFIVVYLIANPFTNNNVDLFLSSANVFTSGVIYYSTSIISHLFIFPFVLTFISQILKKNSDKPVITKIDIINFFKVFPACFIAYLIITLIKIPFYLLIFPGLIITVYFTFLPVFVGNREKSIFRSITASISLIKGYFRKVLLFVIIIFFIREIFSFVSGEILHKVAPLYSHTFFDNLVLFRENFLIRVVLNYFFSSIISAYIATAYYFLFRKIKEER